MEIVETTRVYHSRAAQNRAVGQFYRHRRVVVVSRLRHYKSRPDIFVVKATRVEYRYAQSVIRALAKRSAGG